jgi:molybdate transport system substrate-binding protein
MNSLQPGSSASVGVCRSRTGMGIAVRAGAAKPDISTVLAFKRSLLHARSVAYSRTGASGIYFAALIERLGIAEAINVHATIIEKGLTAEALLSHRLEVIADDLETCRNQALALTIERYWDDYIL